MRTCGYHRMLAVHAGSLPAFPLLTLHTHTPLLAPFAQVDDCVRFADESPKPDMSQLLENVFADPRGFGIAADGRYRYVGMGA